MENVSEPPPSCFHFLMKRPSVRCVFCDVSEAAGAAACASSLSVAIFSPLSAAVSGIPGANGGGKLLEPASAAGGRLLMIGGHDSPCRAFLGWKVSNSRDECFLFISSNPCAKTSHSRGCAAGPTLAVGGSLAQAVKPLCAGDLGEAEARGVLLICGGRPHAYACLMGRRRAAGAIL